MNLLRPQALWPILAKRDGMLENKLGVLDPLIVQPPPTVVEHRCGLLHILASLEGSARRARHHAQQIEGAYTACSNG
jgi:hypothetical protein